MEIIALLALVAVVYVIGKSTRRKGKAQLRPIADVRQAVPAPSSKPRSRSTASAKPYAEIEENGSYRPLIADEVAALAEPFKADARVWRVLLGKIDRHSEAVLRNGKINEALVAEARAALPLVQRREQELTALYDRLFFTREASGDKFYTLIDTFSEIDSDMEHALETIEGIRAEIASGDFEPEGR